MRRHSLIGAMTVVTVLVSLLIDSPANAFSSDVDFNGTLVSEPCVVASGAEGDNVVVDFGTLAEKTFYSSFEHRTWLQPFHIMLTDCDVTQLSHVKITFTGTPDGEQPNLLAIGSSNGVNHLAVGLQSEAGKDISVNKPTESYVLTSGNTQLNFKAYIQASDTGVTNKSVGTGTFEAISTFQLEYP